MRERLEELAARWEAEAAEAQREEQRLATAEKFSARYLVQCVAAQVRAHAQELRKVCGEEGEG